MPPPLGGPGDPEDTEEDDPSEHEAQNLANPTAGKGEQKSRRAADLPPGWTAEEAAAHVEEEEFKHRQPIVCDLLAGPMLAYPTLSELGRQAVFAGNPRPGARLALVRVTRYHHTVTAGPLGLKGMSEEKAALPNFGRGLFARLLVLTVCFVMVSEVLVYVPSIARFRNDWLEQRLATSYLAILALEATPDYRIDPELEIKLLNTAGARVIGLHTRDGKNLLMQGSTQSGVIVSRQIDLDDQMPTTLIKDAFDTLWSGGDHLLRVKGSTPRAGDAWLDVVLDEAPLRQAMISYSWRILGLSIVISLMTAAMIFGALQWLLIRPMRNLTQRMIGFRAMQDHGATDLDRSD